MDMVDEVGTARTRPPAIERALPVVPDDYRLRAHLAGIGADLTGGLTNHQLSGIDAHFMQAAEPLAQNRHASSCYN